MVAVVVAYRFGGVTVGLIAAAVAFLLSWEDRQNALGFAPFLVRIRFKRELLIETGIAVAAQLVPPATVPPETEYWPRRDGITFTVLRLGLFGSEQNLIYWNDQRHFSTRFEHVVAFNDFERAVEVGSARHRAGLATTTPSLEIDQTRDGLEVIVSTGSGNERKLAAVIPYCIFDAPRLGGRLLLRRKRDAMLKRHGWTQDEPTDLGDHGRIPGDFEHRFLSVSFSHI